MFRLWVGGGLGLDWVRLGLVGLGGQVGLGWGSGRVGSHCGLALGQLGLGWVGHQVGSGQVMGWVSWGWVGLGVGLGWVGREYFRLRGDTRKRDSHRGSICAEEIRVCVCLIARSPFDSSLSVCSDVRIHADAKQFLQQCLV